MTTKQRICEAALLLFQEKGYNHVSLREIAEKAGTTIGNLTHHFPNKGFLLVTLQEQFQTEFPLQHEYTKDPEKLLNGLLGTFFAAEKNEREKSFYYRNIYEFYKDSIQARENAEKFRRRLFNYYHVTYTTLREWGIMKKDASPESYINLAYQCVFAASFWVCESSPYYDGALPTIPFAEAMFYLLRPYIEEEYQSLFDSIYQKYRDAANAGGTL